MNGRARIRDASRATSATRRATIEPRRLCAWCPGEIPGGARRDAVYCSTRCRQAAHRFRRGYVPKPSAVDRALRLAYADPPYPGTAERCYGDHPDYAGEVDHAALLEQLVDEYPDGWALSTSARALREVWALCPDDVWLAVWARGHRPTRAHRPLNGYECVLVRGGRQLAPAAGATPRLDTLVYVARPRLTDARRVTGAKPAEFLWWLFDLLGARPGDELDDLFPGSGGVARAWRIFCEGPPRAVAAAPRDDSRRAGDARRVVPAAATRSASTRDGKARAA